MDEKARILDENDDYMQVGCEWIVSELEEAKKRAQERNKKRLRELWMKGSSKNVPIRYLTDDPVEFAQHHQYIDGRWKKFTCRNRGKDIIPGRCPLCDAKWPKSVKAAYLVLDRRVFELRDGTKVSDEVKIWIVSKNQHAYLEERKSDFGGTLLQEWKVARHGESTSTLYIHDPVDINIKLTEEEKNKIKATLLEFKDEWDAFRAKTKSSDKIEHYIVKKFVSAIPLGEMKELVDKREAFVKREKNTEINLDSNDPFGEEEEFVIE